MATKKQKTITGYRALVEKYRNDEARLNTFFSAKHCLLCVTHNTSGNEVLKGSCRGCPNATVNADACDYKLMPSYDEAFIEHESRDLSYSTKTLSSASGNVREPFEARAQAIEDMIPQLEALPDSAFTRKGWKYEYFKNIGRK